MECCRNNAVRAPDRLRWALQGRCRFCRVQCGVVEAVERCLQGVLEVYVTQKRWCRRSDVILSSEEINLFGCHPNVGSLSGVRFQISPPTNLLRITCHIVYFSDYDVQRSSKGFVSRVLH